MKESLFDVHVRDHIGFAVGVFFVRREREDLEQSGRRRRFRSSVQRGCGLGGVGRWRCHIRVAVDVGGDLDAGVDFDVGSICLWCLLRGHVCGAVDVRSCVCHDGGSDARGGY